MPEEGRREALSLAGGRGWQAGKGVVGDGSVGSLNGLSKGYGAIAICEEDQMRQRLIGRGIDAFTNRHGGDNGSSISIKGNP